MGHTLITDFPYFVSGKYKGRVMHDACAPYKPTSVKAVRRGQDARDIMMFLALSHLLHLSYRRVLLVKLRRKQNAGIYLIPCCERLRTGREVVRAVLAGVTAVQEKRGKLCGFMS